MNFHLLFSANEAAHHSNMIRAEKGQRFHNTSQLCLLINENQEAGQMRYNPSPPAGSQ